MGGPGGPNFLERLEQGPPEEHGLFANMLPASASPYGSLLSPEQIHSLRRQSILAMAASLLEGAGPHPQGTTNLSSILGSAIKAGDWQGNLERAGKAGLDIGQLEYKYGNMKSIRDVIQQHGAKPGTDGEVSTSEQLRGFRDTTAALMNLGTPEALEASDKVASAGKLFKEAAPSQHSIHWMPVVEGGKKFNEAHNPITGAPILGPDGNPMRLPEGVTPPSITEAQTEANESRINEHFITNIHKYDDLDQQYKAYKQQPWPTGLNARLVRSKQAQQIIGTAAAGFAEDPHLEGILGFIAQKAGALQAKGDISEQDSRDLDRMVDQAHDEIKRSGHRLFKAYDDTAHQQGYDSPTLNAFRGDWGDESSPSTQKAGNASAVDKALGR
jgi:hypothetical protein